MLPLLDLLGGAEEAPAHDWGLHPFFERLLREQRSPGQKVGIPLLVPINLLEMPETIPDMEVWRKWVVGMGEVERCEELCDSFSSSEEVKQMVRVYSEESPFQRPLA